MNLCIVIKFLLLVLLLFATIAPSIMYAAIWWPISRHRLLREISAVAFFGRGS